MFPFLLEEGKWQIIIIVVVVVAVFLEGKMSFNFVPHCSLGWHELNIHVFCTWTEHLPGKSEDVSWYPGFSIHLPHDCGHMQLWSLNFNFFICHIGALLSVPSLLRLWFGKNQIRLHMKKSFPSHNYYVYVRYLIFVL